MEACTIFFVIGKAKTSEFCFTRIVGIGSSEHVLDGVFCISPFTSAGHAGDKDVRQVSSSLDGDVIPTDDSGDSAHDISNAANLSARSQ